MPITEPAHAAVIVNDGVAVAPIARESSTWSPGTEEAEVNDANRIRSRSVGLTPAISSARWEAMAPISPAVSVST